MIGQAEVSEIPLQLPQAPTTAAGPVAAGEIQADNVVIESMDRYGDLEALSPRISEIIDTATVGMVATEGEAFAPYEHFGHGILGLLQYIRFCQ